MLWKKDNPDRNRQLDRMGRTIIRASQATEKEIETAVSSPALLERIRARAATGEARPSGTINNWAGNNWAADILAAPRAIAWRAIPALSLVAAVALTLWMSATSNRPDNSFGNPMKGVEIIQSDPVAPATACSVATKEECAVSTDDAVAILVSATAKETNR
ncbi:MAG TPA: hypothetical protein VF131_03865 [Blastocatellia bacterium]|nr:hypothetical protein [Blastocatellia bacterium]